MGYSSAEIWWKYVPSSRKLVKDTAFKLLDDGMSIQLCSEIGPWYDQFKEDLKSCIDRYGNGIDLEYIDGTELAGGRSFLDDIIDFLHIEDGFNGKLSSVMHKLPEQGLILWLNELIPSQEAECRILAEEAYKTHGRDGSSKLMLIFESQTRKKTRGLHIVGSAPCVNEDIKYFAYRVLSEGEFKEQMEYAVSLAMELSKGKIELCAGFCEDILRYGLKDPLKIAGNDSAGSRYAVHRAQIRCLEPLIQLCRIQLIQDEETQIKKLLPVTDDYGGEYTEPYELELRHLWHHRDEIGFTRDELFKLKLLYDARNDLSHQHLLEYGKILELTKLIG